MSYRKTIAFIFFPIVIHLALLPFVSLIISVLFYNGRFGFFKFLSYGVGHDLYKVIIIYSLFVLGYRYWFSLTKSSDTTKETELKTLVINNGKSNIVINIEEIVQITSATPYVLIHLENRKLLHSETLKSICLKLEKQGFIRVHKSAVVNLSKVNSYKSRLNGDYDIQLKNDNVVRLSRTYSADFKKAFEKD
ncbi:LytR/AlgR family response regulator transcription factor [Tenacibaculum xiamenense]|uniref:LytR/AlgR family response regulator transcription factor n=1 Tax=Tenacibaculum xiamenense TaxID=1261553 RepID=UPI0038B4433C